MSNTAITLEICPQLHGQPPQIRCTPGGAALTADTDEALVARAMLTAAAYMHAQGQAVTFGAEIPVEVLR